MLHGLVIAGMTFTFAHKLDIIDQSAPVVPVDLVTLAARTNVMASVKHEPKIAPPNVVPRPAPPVEAPQPPQPDNSEPAPSQNAEPIVRPAPAPPKPKAAQKAAKKGFDVDNVLALLNKVAPAQKQTNARVADRDVIGIGAQNAMTADLLSILQSKLQSCWSVDALSGSPHPENLIVTLDIFLSPDGSVAQPPQLVAELSSSASDPYFRVAKEAAIRALYECAPFQLPADRYSQWREISFTFDPRKMMGD